ncbi:MAG TPA: hypothetical protein VFE07_06785 [Marmoricola sp.]|nr:hypothetical protein [Marmoricola sp.]
MPYDDVPPLLPPDQIPAIRSAADLLQTWRAVLGPLGFSRRSLWLMFLSEDGRPSGPLITIDDLPDGPYDVPADDLVDLCDEILRGPGGGRSVALLLTRAGSDGWHVGDRAWGRFLTTVAERVSGPTWPVHRANDVELAAV